MPRDFLGRREPRFRSFSCSEGVPRQAINLEVTAVRDVRELSQDEHRAEVAERTAERERIERELKALGES